ncbi:MAG: Lar family restriction alleviation protein [Exiguobacterium sp.]|nr:Lar family restriction alleviation protein [Exiguobacterium sp.]
MSESKLKPCPFCRGKEMRIEKHVYFNFSSTYGVKCLTCKASTNQFYCCEEFAVDAWNRRANDEQADC